MNKGEKKGKRGSSPFGGIRKRLSDITNLHSQLRSSPHVSSKDKENAPGSSTKSYIKQLLMENAAMMKTIQEKEKVIESAGIEMQKLRALVHKAQLQNWQLAQSNSQMLAELNLGKDKLKLLRHELGCKEALIKAKSAKLEEKTTVQVQTNGLQENAIEKCESYDSELCGLSMKESETNLKKEPPSHPVQDKNESKVVRNKKRQPSRSRSMGPTTSQQAVDKEKAENKRRCVRRESARLNQKQESRMELFEIDVANFPMTPAMNDDKSISDIDVKGIKKDHEVTPNDSGQPRSAHGRPLRRSVGKVQTYKEPSLVTKMRRPS